MSKSNVKVNLWFWSILFIFYLPMTFIMVGIDSHSLMGVLCGVGLGMLLCMITTYAVHFYVLKREESKDARTTN